MKREMENKMGKDRERDGSRRKRRGGKRKEKEEMRGEA